MSVSWVWVWTSCKAGHSPCCARNATGDGADRTPGRDQRGNQARDGGGYVPSSNGSSVGSLFFLGIPHELGLARERAAHCLSPARQRSRCGAVTASDLLEFHCPSSVAAGGPWTSSGPATPASWAELVPAGGLAQLPRLQRVRGQLDETGSQGTSDSASVVSSDEGQGWATASRPMSVRLAPAAAHRLLAR